MGRINDKKVGTGVPVPPPGTLPAVPDDKDGASGGVRPDSFVKGGRTEVFREGQAILALSSQAVKNEILGHEQMRSDLKQIYQSALERIRTRTFNAERRPSGQRFSTLSDFDSLVEKALIQAYKDYYKQFPSRLLSEAYFKSGAHYHRLFAAFLKQRETELSLVGKKHVEAHATTYVAETPESISMRISASFRTLAYIESIYSQVPDGAAGKLEFSEKMARASNISRELAGFGKDEANRKNSLKKVVARNRAVELLSELKKIRDDADVLHAKTFVDFGDKRIARYFSGMRKETKSWIDAHEKQITIPKDQLLKIVLDSARDYVAIWLSEQVEGTPETITHSRSAHRKASLLLDDSSIPEAQREKVKGLVGRILFHVVSNCVEEGFQATANDTVADQADRPDILKRRVITVDELSEVVGTDNLGRIDRFYSSVASLSETATKGILDTNDDAEKYAREFYSFLRLYVRYASHEYGEEFTHDSLAKGPDTKIARSIFARIENASMRFDEKVLRLFSRFFETNFPDAKIPKLFELMPLPEHVFVPKPGAAIQPGERGKIVLTDEMESTAYFAQFPGMTAERQEAFFNYTGSETPWKTFIVRGSTPKNPETIDRMKWRTIVENWGLIYALSSSRGKVSPDISTSLSEFLKKHRPPNRGPETWDAEVDAMMTWENDKLLDFVSEQSNKPKKVEDDVWEAYVEWLKVRGRLEDVAVEPLTQDGRFAVIPAIMFLSELADEHNLDFDPLDVFRAISPVVRRMTRRTRDGHLAVEVPPYMTGIPERNRNYQSFVKALESYGKDSQVRESTRASHTTKNHYIDYWNLRRYVNRATQDGGDDFETLYEFLAGYLRWYPGISQIVQIEDTEGNRRNAPADETKSPVKIILDEREKSGVLPSASILRKVDRQVDSDVRAHKYDSKIEAFGGFLTAVSLLSNTVKVTNSDGKEISLTELKNEFETISKEHAAMSSIICDLGVVPPEHRAEARKFYRTKFKQFAEKFEHDSVFSVETPIDGKTAEVKLVFGENFSVAKDMAILNIGSRLCESIMHTRQNAERQEMFKDLLHLRAILALAVARAEISPEDAVKFDKVKAYFANVNGRFARPLENLIREHTGLHDDPFGSTSASTFTAASTNGKMTTLAVSAYLTSRPTWQNDLEKMAIDNGLTKKESASAVAALCYYFKATRYMYRRYWPETLRSAIESVTDDAQLREKIESVVKHFMATQGLPITSYEFGVEETEYDELYVADAAVEDYQNLFPALADEQYAIPVNREIICGIVNMYLQNAKGVKLNKETIVVDALKLLEKANAGKKPPSFDDLPKYNGILRQTILDTAAELGENGRENIFAGTPGTISAYFSLLPKIRKRENLSDGDIAAALCTTIGSDDFVFFKTFLERQEEELATVLRIANDPALGIAKTVDEKANSIFGPTKMELLATAFFIDRLTTNLPIEAGNIALDLLPEQIAQSPEVARWASNTYLFYLEKWFAKTSDALSKRVGEARTLVKKFAAEPSAKSQTEDQLKRSVARTLNVASFDDLIKEEKAFRIFSSAVGRPVATGPTLIEVVSEALAARQTKGEQELSVEMRKLVDDALRVRQESLRLFTRTQNFSPAESLDESGAAGRIEQSNSITASLSSLGSQIAAIRSLSQGIEAKRVELDTDPYLSTAISTLPSNLEVDDAVLTSTLKVVDAIVASAAQYIDMAENNCLSAMMAAEERRDCIISERVSKKLQVLSELDEEISKHLSTVDKTLHGELLPKLDAIKAFTFSSDDTADRKAFAAKNATLFKDIKAVTPLLEKSTRALDAAHSKIDGDAAGQARAEVRSALQILATAQKKHGEEALAEMIIKIEGLIEKEDLLRKDIEDKRAEITPNTDLAFALIREAEAKLLPEEPSIIKSPIPIREGISDSAPYFSAPVRKQEHRAAIAALSPLLSSKLLSLDGGSYLIADREALRVNKWRESRRNEAITVTSLFGENISITPETYGVFVHEPKNLVTTHQFAKAIQAIRTLAASQSRELLAVSICELDTFRPQFMDLMSHLANASGLATDDLKKVVRLWALSSEISLHLSSSAKTTKTVYGSIYSQEEHARWASAYELFLNDPDIESLSLVNGSLDSPNYLWVGAVRGAETTAQITAGGRTFNYYNPRSGRWESVAAAKVSGANSKTKIMLRPYYNETPGVLTRLKLQWLIFSDPDLMELGWLYQISNNETIGLQGPGDLPRYNHFMTGLTEALSVSALGQKTPFTLSEAQSLAVSAYKVLNNGPDLSISADDVTERDILAWFDSIRFTDVDEYKRRKIAFQNNLRQPSMIEYVSTLYLIHHFSGDLEAEKSYLSKFLIFAHSDEINLVFDKKEAQEMASKGFKARIDEHAINILRNIYKPLFVSPDETLAKTNSETERVGKGQLWIIMQALSNIVKSPIEHPQLAAVKRRLESAPSWIFLLMQRFPSLANALAIIALTYDDIPVDFRTGLLFIAGECFKNSRIVESERAHFENHITALYKDQAQPGVDGHDAIIRALQKEFTDGMTLAEWLTGKSRPWEGQKEWKDLSVVERLKLFTPELFKLTGPTLQRMRKKIIAIQEEPIGRNILAFMEANPDLETPILMLASTFDAKAVDLQKAAAWYTRFFTLFSTKVPSSDEFADFVTDPSNLKDIRNTLTKIHPSVANISGNALLTGEEKPYLPTEYLPVDLMIKMLIPETDQVKPCTEKDRAVTLSIRDSLSGSGNAFAKGLYSFMIGKSQTVLAAVVGLNATLSELDAAELRSVRNFFSVIIERTPEEFVKMLRENGIIPKIRKFIASGKKLDEDKLLVTVEGLGSMRYGETEKQFGPEKPPPSRGGGGICSPLGSRHSRMRQSAEHFIPMPRQHLPSAERTYQPVMPGAQIFSEGSPLQQVPFAPTLPETMVTVISPSMFMGIK